MSEPVLDASALLAVMLEERGSEKVRELLPGAIIGAVNLAEVVAKLQERGVPDAEIDRAIARLDLPVIPFDTAQAMVAGEAAGAHQESGPVARRPRLPRSGCRAGDAGGYDGSRMVRARHRRRGDRRAGLSLHASVRGRADRQLPFAVLDFVQAGLGGAEGRDVLRSLPPLR